MAPPVRFDGQGRRVWDSDGRRLLRRILATMTAVELARLVRVSTQAISDLATGRTREPTLTNALALERAGVPLRSWTRGPTKTGPPDPCELTMDESDDDA